MSLAIADVRLERERQIYEKGWSREHDDQHTGFELAMAGAKYAEFAASRQVDDENYKINEPPLNWPWADEYWKPKSPRQDLVRAAALIIAEIERLDRMAV